VYFTLLERIGPIRSNVVSYLAPVSATLAAFLVLGQSFELRAALAYALIATGFWLIARPSRGAKKPARPSEEAAVQAEEAP
jgi:drug/metabolite transporter (DMT)-like permease